jgi:WD40 repeat protein
MSVVSADLETKHSSMTMKERLLYDALEPLPRELIGLILDYDVLNGRCEKVITGHSASVRCLALLKGSNGEDVVASASDNGMIMVWDAATRRNISIINAHESTINCLLVLRDGMLASCSADKHLKIWNPFTGRCQRIFVDPKDAIACMIECRDGRIASIGDDISSAKNSIKFWNPKKKRDTFEKKRVGIEYSGVLCMLELNDGCLVLGSSFDGKIFIVNNAGTCVQTLGDCKDAVFCLASLRGGGFASGSADGSIKVWELRRNEEGNLVYVCNRTLTGHTKAVLSFILLDGRWLVSSSNDNSIRLWNPDTGDCIKELGGFGDNDVALSFLELSNGKLLSGSMTNSIRLWN